jgi:predicted patatin/cPLA2 family phospholipase
MIVNVKVYSTKSSRYSTIGRKMERLSKSIKESELMPPKYGKALQIENSKQKLNNLFNN